MAFVRRKIVHGNTYYQLVRNYREEGKHRQEVIYHLGKHKSLAAAIAQLEESLARDKSDIASYRSRAKRCVENPNTRDLMRKYFGGRIPSLGEAKTLRAKLLEQRCEYFGLPQNQKSWERLNELDTEWYALWELIESYRLREKALQYEHMLIRREEELNKLLELQREYR